MPTASPRQARPDPEAGLQRALRVVPPSAPAAALRMQRPDSLPSHGGGRRWLAWAAFVLVVLTHAGALLVLRDVLSRKQRITVPEPIVVTLIEAPQPLAEAAGDPVPEAPAPAPRPQPPSPPREAVAPVAPPAPAEPVVQPREPTPPPRPEPVKELPPAPPMPETIAPAPPAPVAPPAPASEPAPPLAAGPAPASPASAIQAPAATSTGPPAAATSGPPTPPSYNASYLDNPKPTYPLSARQRRVEGTVRLRVLVSPAGAVDDVQVHQTSGSPALDRSALEAVKQWRFVPARQGERTVPAWVIVPIVFTLKG